MKNRILEFIGAFLFLAGFSGIMVLTMVDGPGVWVSWDTLPWYAVAIRVAFIGARMAEKYGKTEVTEK